MPTTIQYCSDLHLEFHLNRKWLAKYPLAVKGDVLLLGGDIMLLAEIGNHQDFLDYLSAHFETTYWIPGNHEFYNNDIESKMGLVQEAVRENVFLVNDTVITLGDTDVICSTLWSHIGEANRMELTRALTDFRAIKMGGNRLTAADYNQMHEQSRLFITGAVEQSTARHKVVLTHHVPTFMNYPAKYRGDVMSEAFAVEMHDFIEDSGVDAWLYGHTHSNTPDFRIGRTQLLTNQLGYVQYGENKHFDNAKTLML